MIKVEQKAENIYEGISNMMLGAKKRLWTNVN